MDQPRVPVPRGSRAELYAAGKALRAACPRTSHATWKAPSDRPGAVDLVLAAEAERLPMAYADQNERDHAELDRAVRQGRVPAVFEDAR